MSPKTLDLEKIKENRKKREEQKKSTALAKRFENGISIMNTDLDDEGKRRIAKERFFNIVTYDLEGIYDESGYTPEEADYLKKYISQASASSGSALALICQGAACPFADRCPRVKFKKAPKGLPCPEEMQLYTEWLLRYISELNVDPTNMMELDYCNELAETDVLLRRLNKSLAKVQNAEMLCVQESFNRAGEKAEQKMVSPLLEARDKLVKRRERVVKLMVGDRQEQYKKAAALKLKEESDESIRQSKQRALIIDAQIVKEREAIEVPKDDECLTPDDILNSDILE